VTVIVPFIILLIAWAAAANVELASDTVKSLVCTLPYIFALIAIIMSVWYQNSNTFYLVCFILLAYIFMNASYSKPQILRDVVTMTSILVPINTVWLAFSKERGITSNYGRNKAIIIFGQIIWIIISMIGKSGSQPINGVSESVIGVKAPAIVLYVLSIAVVLSSYILRKQYMNLIYILVLIMSFISLHFASRPALVSIFTSAAFCIIVIALLDLSYSLVFYDALTGVLSRRALEQEFLRLGSNYAMAMVDLDHFKKINDNFGHDVGDEVLKMVASVMTKNAGNGKVFRYGGEEFVVLFSGNPYNDIIFQLEKMRKAIERRPFIIRAEDRPKERPEKIRSGASKGRGSINITVSIGVAQKNDTLRTCQDVIKKADEALYKSKSSGRNIVTKA
jgi:diguanylate cyclase (GGDEF)-like protein